jgi:hypothetical protein
MCVCGVPGPCMQHAACGGRAGWWAALHDMVQPAAFFSSEDRNDVRTSSRCGLYDGRHAAQRTRAGGDMAGRLPRKLWKKNSPPAPIPIDGMYITTSALPHTCVLVPLYLRHALQLGTFPVAGICTDILEIPLDNECFVTSRRRNKRALLL